MRHPLRRRHAAHVSEAPAEFAAFAAFAAFAGLAYCPVKPPLACSLMAGDVSEETTAEGLKERTEALLSGLKVGADGLALKSSKSAVVPAKIEEEL